LSVDTPVVGERITYDWAVDVATDVNALTARMAPDVLDRLSSDESINTSTVANISGWAHVAQPSGRTLCITGRVDYSCANTNQGLGIGFRHGGGTAHGIVRIFGVSGGATEAIERLATNTANTDEMTTSATVSTGGAHFVCEFTFFYTSNTASGSINVRKRLNGTPGSTGLTIYQGSYIRTVAVD
jgi:hypothetical protein